MAPKKVCSPAPKAKGTPKAKAKAKVVVGKVSLQQIMEDYDLSEQEAADVFNALNLPEEDEVEDPKNQNHKKKQS